MNELCQAVERRPGVFDCTVFHGFPYTDIPEVGVHVLCTTNDEAGLARGAAQEVAHWVWEHRESFRAEAETPEEAVRLALEVDGGPVVINDTADNPGGGAPGDGTHVLRAFVDAKLDNACFGFICDPEVAEAAHRGGVGSTIHVSLGGKHDRLHGEPISVTAYVKCLTDGKFVLQAMGAGFPLDLGRMARLVVDGLDILVSSIPSQTLDPEVFLLHGIDVRRYKTVGLKSSQHFKAGFGPLAKAIITADSPGLTTLRTERLERKRCPRPMWPKDPAAEYRGRPTSHPVS